jgi:hypothetical protein
MELEENTGNTSAVDASIASDEWWILDVDARERLQPWKDPSGAQRLEAPPLFGRTALEMLHADSMEGLDQADLAANRELRSIDPILKLMCEEALQRARDFFATIYAPAATAVVFRFSATVTDSGFVTFPRELSALICAYAGFTIATSTPPPKSSTTTTREIGTLSVTQNVAESKPKETNSKPVPAATVLTVCLEAVLAVCIGPKSQHPANRPGPANQTRSTTTTTTTTTRTSTAMSASVSASESSGKKESGAAIELAVEIQRALMPRDGEIKDDRVTADYSSRLLGVCQPLRQRDLTGVDTSVWLLPAHECSWPKKDGANEQLPNPLWALLRAAICGANDETLASAFDVLLRTGCARGDVLNSCDSGGWSLGMCATRCERAFKFLHTEPALDWAYECEAPTDKAVCYSMLSEAIFVGDAYGLYALCRLNDDTISRLINRQVSSVMHRLLCPNFLENNLRMQTLKALRRRTGIVWTQHFPADASRGSLPTIAIRSNAPGAAEFWDIFASPHSPWHSQFMSASNRPQEVKWEISDTLRAASIHPLSPPHPLSLPLSSPPFFLQHFFSGPLCPTLTGAAVDG